MSVEIPPKLREAIAVAILKYREVGERCGTPDHPTEEADAVCAVIESYIEQIAGMGAFRFLSEPKERSE